MSYTKEGGNPYHRSWANPGPDMSGIVKLLAEISANSVTTYAERKEASEKFRQNVNKGLKKQEELRLNFPSFSEQAKKILESKGYAIYRLRGLSLQKMLDNNGVVRTWDRGATFEEEVSFKGEVAVNPYLLEVRGTSGKNFNAQKHIFNNFKTKLEKELPGVTAKIVNFADCVDLELAHKEKHERGILDRYFIGGVRTTTQMYPDHSIILNTSFTKRLELNITAYIKNTEGSQHVGLGALVLPRGSNWDGKTDYW